MLVLSQKKGQKIAVYYPGGDELVVVREPILIEFEILRISGSTVRVGTTAPQKFHIQRWENFIKNGGFTIKP